MGTARDVRTLLQLYADGLRPIVDQPSPFDYAAGVDHAASAHPPS